MKNRKRGRLLIQKKISRKNNSGTKSAFFDYLYSDLSTIEDTQDRSFFEMIGKKAATNAINENKAMHIPITFLQDDWIVRRMPSGAIEKIHQLNRSSVSHCKRKLKKGNVLHIKKIR